MVGKLASTIARKVRADAYPENTTYVDNGCSLAPACLTCPLAVCRYDAPPQSQERGKRKEHARALRDSGLTAGQIADVLGVSTRTAFRYLEGS